MADIRIIEDGQFKNIIKRRLFTLKHRIKLRIQAEDIPEPDDGLIKEWHALVKLARFHGMRNY